MTGVKLHTRLVISMIQVERSLGRNVQQGGVLYAALCLVVEDLHRLLPLMELILDKLSIFFLANLVLALGPERLHGVEGFQLNLLDFLCALDDFALIVTRHFLCLKIHLNRVAHIVRILLYQILQIPGIGKVLLCLIPVEILAKSNRDGGTAAFLLAILQGIGTVTGRLPANSLASTSLAGSNSNLLCYHESRIEAHAELPNHFLVRQLRIILLCLLQLLQKCLGAGLGNSTDILYHLVPGHADTVIGNSQGMTILVRHQENLIILVALKNITVLQGLKMQLVNSIRRIGNQLTEENLVIGINAVNHQIQQLFSLCLKFMGCLCHKKLSPFYVNLL